MSNSTAYNLGAGSIGSTGTGSFATFGGGDAAPTGILSQTIGTVSGETYILSFQYGAAGSTAATQSLQITVGNLNTTITSAVSDNNLPTALADYCFSFIAAGSTTTISFADMSGVTISVDGRLDNVSIPGPASLLLIGAGLIGTGLARRRSARSMI